MEGHLLAKCVGKRTELDGTTVIRLEPERQTGNGKARVKAEIVLPIGEPEASYEVGQTYWLKIE